MEMYSVHLVYANNLKVDFTIIKVLLRNGISSAKPYLPDPQNDLPITCAALLASVLFGLKLAS